MDPHQRFLFRGKKHAIQVRKDSKRGYYYSRINDIQSIFPGASQFKIDDATISFLKNEQGDLIEPKRIGHYPYSIVEVVTVAQEPTTAASTVSSDDRIALPTTKPRSLKNTVLNVNSSKPLGSSVDFVEDSVSALDVVEASNVSTLSEMDSNAIPGVDSMDRNTISARGIDNFNTTSEKSWSSSKTDTASGVKPKYYVPPLHSFVQMVKAKGGMWDPALKKASIIFKAEYVAVNFFVKLLSQGTEVQDLDLALEWNYQKSDLTRLVDQVASSNVRFLRLDMNEHSSSAMSKQEAVHSDRDKYQPLLALFSNPKLEGISFVNASHFGSRTTGLRIYQNPSSQVALQSSLTLRSFHFIGVIRATDDALLESILHLCPRLNDLRLGSFSSASEHSPKLEGAIQSLLELQSLHLYNLSPNMSTKNDADDRSSRTHELINPLKTISSVGMHLGHHPLQEVIRQSLSTAETLILRCQDKESRPVGFIPPSQPIRISLNVAGSIDLPFSRLTHLDLSIKLTTDTHAQLASILPGLNLTHFGADTHTKDLVKSVNLASLRSIWLFDMDETYIQPLFDAFLGRAEPCKINTMRFGQIRNIRQLPGLLSIVSLKHVYLSLLGHDALNEIFASMELADLQVLAVFDDKYDWTTEAVLAQRSHLFSERMVFQLGYYNDAVKRDVHDPKSRLVKPRFNRLSRLRVQIVSSHCMYEKFMQSILPDRSIGNRTE
ncbi:hypothetical protein BGW39_003802 [Mortierella sp. 14UC]|nr:hypothetical protein BGW39_003802 [Mortierella sp. 14UC]